MDTKEFKQRATKLSEIAKVLENLPPEIRECAFHLLEDYVTTQPDGGASKRVKGETASANSESREQFFSTFDQQKPAENAKLIAAYLYREYGAEPFCTEEVRQTAKDVGITVPARVDMTFTAAKEKGRNLFTRTSKGWFKPTVHGEAYIKLTYSVNKGTKKRPEPAE